MQGDDRLVTSLLPLRPHLSSLRIGALLLWSSRWRGDCRVSGSRSVLAAMLVSPVSRLLRGPATRILSRSMFTARPRDPSQPNWFAVSLAFGTSAALWVLLFKQHNDDVTEYKRRNGLQ
ncbi:hypothetical protein GDO78_011899 [Eleutherodactylus coqui]|uniref:NADH dehydrogenase [ubiquinone] 1 subunit C1, mitochondrial n=1 Tax=Eleutherodactylus coqui TaxID=57060 RepID=A0A8J6K529_ELECQ|nr:hypothetical protein GDO78_011899 [Eleutherodactylus coqui]